MGGFKDRKLYVAGLALALGGFALDKAVLRGGLSPGVAEAADLLVDPAAKPVAPPAQTPSENTAEVAQRLAAARDRLGLDPSSVTDAFFGAGLNGKVAEQEADLSPAARLQRDYKLHAVMRSEGGTSLALLETKNDKGDFVKFSVRVGEKLGNSWTLVAVETLSKPRSATFKSDDCTVVLTLAGEKPDASDQKPQDQGPADR